MAPRLDWETVDTSGLPKIATLAYGYDYAKTTIFLRAPLPHGWLLWIQRIHEKATFFYIHDPAKAWGRENGQAEKVVGEGGSSSESGFPELLVENAQSPTTKRLLKK